MVMKLKVEEKRDSMNWHYFACNRCDESFRTVITNPDSLCRCATCDNQFFHEITKEDYDKERRRAPFPK